MSKRNDPALDLIDICEKWGFDISKITSRWRIRELTVQRRVVAKEMRILGHSLTSIAAVMKRDHTSIKYMCDDEFRDGKLSRMRSYHPARQ